jgi:phage terminase small subunit
VQPPQGTIPPPAWLPAEGKAEWKVAAADLASRGLLFKGSLGLLAAYCACIAAIQRREVHMGADLLNREVFADQLKAVSAARALSAELGLSVTSRMRAFTAQPTGKDDACGDVVNG